MWSNPHRLFYSINIIARVDWVPTDKRRHRGVPPTESQHYHETCRGRPCGCPQYSNVEQSTSAFLFWSAVRITAFWGVPSARIFVCLFYPECYSGLS